MRSAALRKNFNSRNDSRECAQQYGKTDCELALEIGENIHVVKWSPYLSQLMRNTSTHMRINEIRSVIRACDCDSIIKNVS